MGVEGYPKSLAFRFGLAQVHGLRNGDDRVPVKLMKGSYELEGPPIQTFSNAS